MKVTLEQWQALLTIVDQGGHAKAAEHLGKSQSAVSYAISRLEDALGVQVFHLEGRRSALTPAGDMLYQRARLLLASANAMEQAAHTLASSWQASISLSVDAIFPEELLFQALTHFGELYPLTRVNVLETVLSGSSEALIRRDVSLSITGLLPPGFVGNPLLHLSFVAVAAPHHPLHRLGRELTLSDLHQERQLVVRDSGSQQLDAGWLDATQRWTVSHLSTSIKAAVAGLGFAWYPRLKIASLLANGSLKPLPLKEGTERFATLYLVYADGDFVSPPCQKLGHFLHDACANLNAPFSATAPERK
jgi:DNA-binding transcriptional LysR family regulator